MQTIIAYTAPKIMPTLDQKPVCAVTEFRGLKTYYNSVTEALESIVANKLGMCDVYFQKTIACQIYPDGNVIRIRFVDKNFLGIKLSFPYEIMRPRKK